ncbi:S1 family peptidase [Nocardia sp. GCM10030253]|uniref:S1 family peptidase n=1 Tax=Nocardia sp. GCM10030253 TaxID=3273404 RepID=UPI003639826E
MRLGTRARRAALGCCWVALAVAGSTTHPASATPEVEDVPLPQGMVEAVRRDLGIDAYEYLRRAETAQRLAAFATTARIAHRAAFAGIRMDGDRPVVSLTDDVNASDARAAAEEAGFTVETVTDSEVTLHGRGVAFERWLAGQSSSVTDAVIGYGIDVVTNSLAVRLAKDLQLPVEAGQVRTLLAVMPEARPDDAPVGGMAIADAEPAADFIGGQPYGIELAGKTYMCSFGFNGTDAEGHTVNVTAGHCDPNTLVDPASKTPQPQRIFDIHDSEHGVELGYFGDSSFSPHDYSILRINEPVAARFQNNLVSTAPAPDAQAAGTDSDAELPTGSSGGRWLGVDAEREVLRIDGTAEPIVGDSVCKSGFKSGYSCGTVIAVGQRSLLRGAPGHDEQGIPVENMFYVNLCAQRGDSGGPIFAGTKAVGINSAIVTHQTPLDGNCGHLPVLLGQPISTVLMDNPGLTIRTS